MHLCAQEFFYLAKYIIYIDESNILSKTGHSVYIALYVKLLDKNTVSEKILNIEKDLKISYLHWVDMPWKLRIKFAQKIKNIDFICKLIVYKNPIIQEKTLENFLYYILSFEDNIFKIIIDGNKGKRYKNKLKSLLKNRGLRFYQINFSDDKREPMIRLADFIIGFYRSFLYNKNKENICLYILLKDKIKIPN